MSHLVAFAELQQVTGYTRVGDVVRRCRECGIHVFPGKGGVPWTTLELINQAGGARASGEPIDLVKPYPVDVA